MSQPVSYGVNPSGYIKPLALDASGKLIVNLGFDPAGGSTLLVDADGRPIVQGYGGNVLFGYKDRLIYEYVNLNLPAGTTIYDWAPVPAQEVDIVTNVAYIYTGTIAAVYVTFCIHNGANFYRFYKHHPATTAIMYYSVVNIVMKAADTLSVIISGAVLNDDIQAYCFGYSMNVP